MKYRYLVIAVVVVVIGASAVMLVWRATTPEWRAVETAERDAASPMHVQEFPAEPVFEETGDQLVPLWHVVDERTASRPPEYPGEWSRAGRVLVDVSPAAAYADSWRVGDRLVLPLPQLGESYEGTIERIAGGPGVSRSVRGLAVGADDRERRFVVTVGPTRILAYIDTIRGPYELVADTRQGWLVPTSSMLAGIDFSKPDYVIPAGREPDHDPR